MYGPKAHTGPEPARR